MSILAGEAQRKALLADRDDVCHVGVLVAYRLRFLLQAEQRAAVVAHGSLKVLDDLAKKARTALKSNSITALCMEKPPGQVMYPARKSPDQWVKPMTDQLRSFMAARRV